MEANLYALPKDMLIKLISTIKDYSNLTSRELLGDSQKIIEEMEGRKTRRIKQVLLEDRENIDYIDLIDSIQYIKLRHCEGRVTSHLQICFSNGTMIRSYIGANEICCHLYSKEQKYICFITGMNSVNWLENKKHEYEIYVNFIHKVLYFKYISFNYYLNPLVSINYI